MELPRMLREAGLDPRPVVEAAGTTLETLADVEAQIPFSVYARLVVMATEATGRPSFGAEIGQAARRRHMGVIGDLLATAPTLRDSIVALVSNHRHYVRGGGSYLVDWPPHGLLVGYRTHLPRLQGAVRVAEGTVAFGISLFHELSGERPIEVLISRPAPADPAPYRAAYGGAKIRFGAAHFGIVYSTKSLSTPLPTADRARHANLWRLVAERWAWLRPDIGDQVLRALVPAVLTGSMTQRSVAHMVGLSSQSLSRALRARNLTFRDLLNEARFEMSCQLLVDAPVEIAQLSEIVGYSEVSAFTRFFTRYAGVSPAEWRKMQTRTPADGLALAAE